MEWYYWITIFLGIGNAGWIWLGASIGIKLRGFDLRLDKIEKKIEGFTQKNDALFKGLDRRVVRLEDWKNGKTK